ncbi:Uroporphyrinogen-III C-methyltransferase [Planktothrix tepida]|uniref:uroporphyrinogen-III C-methyltransferase n=1 Tax=Planktothrix tepida PCC 9214 TaxID=671072 RepID=A0A1J1LHK7_9CYAN|nr:uroporphyrinogen-III C-methyltransferase [Planktothrix tepida]CAD5910935.1 Uroporphyrinogen-III C-methyltransferase [Planktothrix tepida]CUR32093.1 Uroporphyrinogen III methylase [Planktothrix tepida PCC 9214]
MIGQKGKVYLMGAGLGEIAYLTLQAQALLSQAEVIIYDALVDDSILTLIPANCLKINVGKRGGQPSTPQAEINQLLVEYCLRGKQVIRLKGGDPFIFGRTTSEIQALIESQCNFEVIPGLSSALAAPTLASIPLTDPVMSRCFAVMTAHDLEALDWQIVSQIETLVILMGGRNLAEIVHQLLRHERLPQTPIAIIKSGGCPQQKVWIGTLNDIVEITAHESLSPCVIVVGEVVRLRDFLNPTQHSWQPNQPLENSILNLDTMNLLLFGKTILITRSAEQSSQFSDLLKAQGATVIEMPALVITPPSSWDSLDQAIEQLEKGSENHFDWLIFTSSNGVEYFFNRLINLGKDIRSLGQTKIAVVGKKTAASLQERCLKPDFIPPDFVADSLVEHFPESLEGKRILFPRVETGGREVLVQELTTKGATVVEVAAYESGCPESISPDVLEALQSQKIDVITFASSKTVKNYYQLIQSLPEHTLPPNYLDSICIASIGPQTSKSCINLLGRVDVEPQEYTLEGLTQAIINYLICAADVSAC